MGIIGLLVVVFFILKVNDFNLYCLLLGIVNVVEGFIGKKLKYFLIMLVIGGLGIMFFVLGIFDRFVDFLIVLGVVFLLIIGIMLMDYYVLCFYCKIFDMSWLEGKLFDEI